MRQRALAAVEQGAGEIIEGALAALLFTAVAFQARLGVVGAPGPDVVAVTAGTLERIFTQAIFSYLIVNKRFKCYFWENPSGYKSLTLEKSTA